MTVTRSVNAGDLAELMSDENNSRPAGRERPHGSEKAHRLFVGQHGGRLVENEYARAGKQHFDDLDALAFGDRQFVDAAFGIDIEADAWRPAFGSAVRSRARLDANRPRQLAKKNVLDHRKRPHQLEFLMHHADATGGGVARTAEHHFFAVDERSVRPPAHRGRPRRSSAMTCRRRSRPSSAWTSPASASNSASSRAANPPNDFLTPTSRRAATISALQANKARRGLGRAPRLRFAYFFCVITPGTNQSIFHRSASLMT